eukprot:6482541-Amphidinium_carterae.1
MESESRPRLCVEQTHCRGSPDRSTAVSAAGAPLYPGACSARCFAKAFGTASPLDFSDILELRLQKS